MKGMMVDADEPSCTQATAATAPHRSTQPPAPQGSARTESCASTGVGSHSAGRPAVAMHGGGDAVAGVVDCTWMHGGAVAACEASQRPQNGANPTHLPLTLLETGNSRLQRPRVPGCCHSRSLGIRHVDELLLLGLDGSLQWRQAARPHVHACRQLGNLGLEACRAAVAVPGFTGPMSIGVAGVVHKSKRQPAWWAERRRTQSRER